MNGASSDLRVLGQHALDDFGTRLALLFLATAAVGIPLMSQVIGLRWSLIAIPALAVCGYLMRAGLADGAGAARLLRGLLTVGAVLTTVVVISTKSGDIRGFEVTAWLVAGVAGGVAVSRGPAWGLGTYAALVGIALAVAAGGDVEVPLIVLLGPFTYVAGGAVINVAARRGFVITQGAMAAAESAEAAHRVAVERWRARREADRDLHDTVLATLTLLAQGGVGVPEERLRRRCERDLELLRVGTGAVRPAPPPGPVSTGGFLALLVSEAAGEGLSVTVHEDAADVSVGLSPDRRLAVEAAVRQCVANVGLHAGTGTAEISCISADRQLVVMVVDRGVGFAPEAVPAGRLGLRAGVRDRIEDVGGRVDIWSGHGQGTCIVIRVPTGEPPA